jgi:hypothetical protein
MEQHQHRTEWHKQVYIVWREEHLPPWCRQNQWWLYFTVDFQCIKIVIFRKSKVKGYRSQQIREWILLLTGKLFFAKYVPNTKNI